MTRIDFYHNTEQREAFACRLLRRACKSGEKLVVWFDDDESLGRFDDLLWTFHAQEFLPHLRIDDPLADRTPILLGVSGSADQWVFSSNEAPAAPGESSEPVDSSDRKAHRVWDRIGLNLASNVPSCFSRHPRLLEIISTDESERAAGRARWQFYRDRGYPLTGHDVAKLAAGAVA